MDKVSLLILIDKLKSISLRLYDEDIDGIDGSYELDEIIDDLEGWVRIYDN